MIEDFPCDKIRDANPLPKALAVGFGEERQVIFVPVPMADFAMPAVQVIECGGSHGRMQFSLPWEDCSRLARFFADLAIACEQRETTRQKWHKDKS